MADYLHTGAQSIGAMDARERRARELVASWERKTDRQATNKDGSDDA